MKTIPCSFFPSTIYCIDDNSSFLDSIQIALPDEIPCKCSDNPTQSLAYFNETYEPPFMPETFLQGSDESYLDLKQMTINIRKFHHTIYNANRFNNITIIVIDYAMPNLNGLDFCRQLKHNSIKKILLTGEAGHELAVAAFNDQIIHKFILKSDKDLLNTLESSIEALQYQYFTDFSNNMILNPTTKDDKAFSALKDNAFINLFTSIIKKYKIVEYYLMDTQGSFLMLDKDARPYWLSVKNDTEMQDLMDFARFEDAPNETLNKLATRSHIPYFFTDEDLQTPPGDWGRFMHKATKLKCDSGNYYYALIDDPKAYELDRSKIVSYAEFLAEHN